MNIDLTKPLQLSNGTPVNFLRRDDRRGEIIVTAAEGHSVPTSAHRYDEGTTMSFNESTLKHVLSYLTLQNVKLGFDPTKSVQQRSGNPARILATDLKRRDDHSIAVASPCYVEPDHELVYTVYADGRYFSGGTTDPRDIINVPENNKIKDVGLVS